MEKNFGYIKDEITDSDYILGGLNLPAEVLQSDGQWDKFLPDDDIQRNEYIDTYNCTGYGTINALEFLFKRKFGENRDWSERYAGIESGTYPPGNSPKKVIETIRKKCGLLDEQVLPFNNTIKTIDQYYSPKPIPWLMEQNGRKFLDSYSVGYEWVFNDNQLLNRQNSLKLALTYSPLGIAVYAWNQSSGSTFSRPTGAEDNHWCVLYGYEDGKYWKVWDSYNNEEKKLDWNFGFDRCMRYHIAKITYKSFWDFIKNYFNSLFK